MVCDTTRDIVMEIVDEIIDEVVFNRVDAIIAEINQYYRPHGKAVPNDVRNECYNAEVLLGDSIILKEWINHRIYCWILIDDDMGDVDNGVFRNFCDYHEIIGLI